MDFQNLTKIKIFWRPLFEIPSITFPGGHVRPRIKLGPDRFSRFDAYWIQTNRQTRKVYIYRFY